MKHFAKPECAAADTQCHPSIFHFGLRLDQAGRTLYSSGVHALSRFQRFLRTVGISFMMILVFLLGIWSIGAIYFDGPWPGWPNTMMAVMWLVIVIGAILRFRKPSWRLGIASMLFLIVLIPWLLKKPSHNREWPAEFRQTASASIEGDVVTFHNFRAFDYNENGTPIEKWVTRKVRLSELRGMDFFMTYWGDGKLVGHPIFSFDFGPDGHVAFSIESRREVGEDYTLIGGLYKRYEMIYICGDESDIIRLRTNFRDGENVYLYRLNVRQSTVSLRFLEYLDAMNRIESRPQFYDTLTGNCTTAIRAQITTHERNSLDWRILANGKLDELFYERGMLSKELPFAELKQRSFINPVANQSVNPSGFSKEIREGLPGF